MGCNPPGFLPESALCQALRNVEASVDPAVCQSSSSPKGVYNRRLIFSSTSKSFEVGSALAQPKSLWQRRRADTGNLAERFRMEAL